MSTGINILQLQNGQNYKNIMDNAITSETMTQYLSDNYWDKDHSYSIEQITKMLGGLTNIKPFNVEVVEALPNLEDEIEAATVDPTCIYLVRAAYNKSGNLYTEYIYIPDEEKFEMLGTQDLELDNYLRIDDASNTYVAIGTTIDNAHSSTYATYATQLNRKINITISDYNNQHSTTTDTNFGSSFTLCLPDVLNVDITGDASHADSASTASIAESATYATTAGTAGTASALANKINISIISNNNQNEQVTENIDFSSNVKLFLPAIINADITGNAATASILSNTRVISISDGTTTTGGTEFNGSQNITLTLPNPLYVNIEGSATYATSATYDAEGSIIHTTYLKQGDLANDYCTSGRASIIEDEIYDSNTGILKRLSVIENWLKNKALSFGD